MEVPAAWLTRATVLPDHCVRHGLPVVRRVRFVIKSQPKMKPVTEILSPTRSPLGRAAEYSRQLKLTKVDGWPLCARCAQARAVGLTVANMLFWGGLAGLVVGLVLGSLPTVLAGCAAILGAVVPFSRGSLPRLTHAETSADGESVIITDAHPDFVTRLAALPPRHTP